jgi:hypothetical protein
MVLTNIIKVLGGLMVTACDGLRGFIISQHLSVIVMLKQLYLSLRRLLTHLLTSCCLIGILNKILPATTFVFQFSGNPHSLSDATLMRVFIISFNHKNKNYQHLPSHYLLKLL